MIDLGERLKAVAAALEDRLSELLAPVDGPEGRVVEAMRYAALDGGKRLRPFLVIESAGLFGVPQDRSLNAAAAVEMIHCYSLVHDDLPAMDDSDLRRGRPTCHKAFDEATAILAGDGLLTEAFALCADQRTHPDGAVRAELTAALAKAAGARGMVGGQMIDIAAESGALRLDLEGITHLQSLKTGALIGFSALAGAILGQAERSSREALIAYARDLGLAFQIKDDILDIESTPEELGKPAGQDAEMEKATFVDLLGLEEARSKAHELAERAVASLDLFGESADFLRETARFVVERRK